MVDGSIFNISADCDAMVIMITPLYLLTVFCPNWHQILERKARCTTRTCARARAVNVVDAD